MLVNWLGDRRQPRVLQAGAGDQFRGPHKVPVLMVHGQNDMIAPVDQSIWMCEAIKRGQRQCSAPDGADDGHFGDLIPNSYGLTN